MKKFLCLTLTILLLTGLFGCVDFLGSDDDSGSSSKEPPARYQITGIQMTGDYTASLGYSVNIKGKLKNTSGKEFSYVSVTFAIYDEEGNQIETAMDNTNYLQADSTWSFDATMFGWVDVYPKSCRLVDVVAW